MRTLRVLPRVFAAIGLVLALVAATLYTSERRFVTTATRATGTVVELEGQTDSDGDRMYYPRVRFTTEAGESVTFRGRVGSRPPSYHVGETVEVLYRPGDAAGARIKGFSLYLGTFVTGLLALIFGGIGGVWLHVERRAAALEEDLRAHGRRVQARVVDVELRTNLTVNNRHPWRIVAEWRERESSEPVTFRSANIWDDPAGKVGETVDVFVDRYDPRRYHVDLEFLRTSDDRA